MDYIPEWCQKPTLILGCGNALFGDDGFGPAVIQHLQSHYTVPEDVCVLDMGTGVRDLLCTIVLSPVKPKKIVVIDTKDRGGKPGEVSVTGIEGLPLAQGSSFSLHQPPTLSLLGELKKYCRINVVFVSVQPESIPEAVFPGLSEKVRAAVGPACEYILKTCF